jgi:hypothetical protein
VKPDRGEEVKASARKRKTRKLKDNWKEQRKRLVAQRKLEQQP